MTAPFVPFAAADEAVCADAECDVLALYARSTGQLSALSGDALPGDPATVRRGGFSVVSEPLEGPLVILKRDAFRVQLYAEGPGDVDGEIALYARDLGGQQHLLARRVLNGSALALDDLPVDPHAIYGTVQDANAPLAAANDRLRDIFAHDTGPFLAETGYEIACIPPLAAGCSTLSGRYGEGTTLRGCTASPGGSGYPPYLVWDAFHIADSFLVDGSIPRPTTFAQQSPAPVRDAYRAIVPESTQTPFGGTGSLPGPLAGARVCEGAYRHANETAGQAGQPGPLPPPSLPLVPDAPFARAQPWRNLTLNATPPTWMPQDAESVAIPSGMQLVWSVSLARADTGAPVVLGIGTADAPTRVEVRTATPRAFGWLAAPVERVGDGYHNGTFAHPQDAVDLSFEIPEGMTANLTVPGPATRMTLYSPTGDAVTSSSAITAAHEPGQWTLRLQPMSVALSYSVLLQIVAPDAEPVVIVTEGTTSGSLEGADVRDDLAFHAYKRQHVSLRVESEPGLGIDVALPDGVDAVLRNATWTATETSFELSGEARRTGEISFSVRRAWGEGGYAVTLARDASGDLSLLPAAQLVLDPGTNATVDSVAGWAGGADLVLRTAASASVWHLSATGGMTRLAASGAAPPARTSDGILVRHDPQREAVVHGFDGNDTTPLMRPQAFAFGSDALYGLHKDRLTRIASGSVAETRELNGSAPEGGRLLAAPGGALYFVATDGQARRIDPEGARLVREPAFDGAFAFDAHGRSYRVLDRTLIERHDPTSGERRIVAHSEGTPWSILDGASSGSRLLLRVADESQTGIGFAMLAVVDLGVAGFEGFHPSFTPLPPADLRVAAFEDRIVGPRIGADGLGEEHEFHVTVENAGAGPSPRALLQVDLWCESSCQPGDLMVAELPPLAAGEQTTIAFRWVSGRHVGEQEAWMRVDPYFDVVEANESNNILRSRFFVLVAGTMSTCERVLALAGWGATPTSAVCRFART